MAKKKEEPKLSEVEALNKRVDAMMDPKLPATTSEATPADDMPPLDIFKDAPPEVAEAAKTAPEVSGDLLQKVDTKTEPPVKPKVSTPKPPAKAEPKPALPKSPPPQKQPRTTSLDDQATDKAVEDIASKESDTILELQDAIGRKASHVAGDLAQQDRQAARRRKWAWATLLVVAIVLLLLILPYTPYTCRWRIGIRLSVTTDILPSVCK